VNFGTIPEEWLSLFQMLSFSCGVTETRTLNHETQ
jgi:hypothetical protein